MNGAPGALQSREVACPAGQVESLKACHENDGFGKESVVFRIFRHIFIFEALKKSHKNRTNGLETPKRKGVIYGKRQGKQEKRQGGILYHLQVSSIFSHLCVSPSNFIQKERYRQWWSVVCRSMRLFLWRFASRIGAIHIDAADDKQAGDSCVSFRLFCRPYAKEAAFGSLFCVRGYTLQMPAPWPAHRSRYSFPGRRRA